MPLIIEVNPDRASPSRPNLQNVLVLMIFAVIFINVTQVCLTTSVAETLDNKCEIETAAYETSAQPPRNIRK